MARGSIYQRSPGSWRIQWYVGKDDNGKDQYRNKTFKSKAEAQKELNRILREQDKGTYAEVTDMTVKEYLTVWLSDYTANLSARTKQEYRSICTLHLIPKLGKIPLSKLRALDIQNYYTKEAKTGRLDDTSKPLSQTTMNHHHTVLSKAIRTALRLQLIVHNPMDGVTPPRIATGEKETFTDAEAVQLLAYLKQKSKYYMVVAIALSTGMRLSEILGLKWDCVDLDQARIRVAYAVDRAGGKLALKVPKTEKSRRTIPIPSNLVNELRTYREKQKETAESMGELWMGDGSLVCPDGIGGLNNPNRVSRVFGDCCRLAKIRQLSFHALRHTFATRALRRGVSVALVQAILGHSTISTTIDTYSHVSPEMLDPVGNLMDDLLG